MMAWYNTIMKECHNCGKELVGKQERHCSVKCRVRCNSSYKFQKIRGTERKLELLRLAGNKCSKCGYNKNIGALTFHHIDPKQKSFKLDMRSLSNRSMEEVLREFKKCLLLCANCHIELHHSELTNWTPSLTVRASAS